MKPSLWLRRWTLLTLLSFLTPSVAHPESPLPTNWGNTQYTINTNETTIRGNSSAFEDATCGRGKFGNESAEDNDEGREYNFSNYNDASEQSCEDLCKDYEEYGDVTKELQSSNWIKVSNLYSEGAKNQKTSDDANQQIAAYCIAYQKTKTALDANEIMIPMVATALASCTAACAASALSFGGAVSNNANPVSLAINAACDTADLIASAYEFAYDLSVKDGPLGERLFGKTGDAAANIQGAMTIFGLASGLTGAGASGARFLKGR